MAIFEWKDKTDDQIAKFVAEQHKRAEDKRRIYEDLWSLIIKIFRPRRYDILGNGEKGQQYGADIFDQHPANALNKFVGGLIGYMVSRSIPWLQFIAANINLMQLDHVKDYCQKAAEQILYAARRSNMYSALVPHALDAHSVGTSVIVPMEDIVKDRVVFDVVHPSDSFVVVDKFGDPGIYHRRLCLTRLTATEYFDNDNLPKNWFTIKGDLKHPLTEQEFIWAVYPNRDRDTSSLVPADKEFALFCVIMGSSGAKKSRLVLRSGTDTFPICWRALRESGASYGTSLASDCLTSGLVCNKLSEKALAAAHKAVEPPVVASKSLRASLMRSRLNPGSYVWTEDMNRDSVKPIMDRLNWPISDAQLERKHGQIDDRFFIRFFEMLSRGDMKARTAYEVSQMMAEKATLMSGIVDTFEQESLEGHIDALILHETEAGRMPEPPEELLLAGGRLDIKYLGPLDQLQRTLLKSKGTIDALSIIAEIMAVDQSVGWRFNWHAIAEEVAVAQGMPQKHVKSDEEVDTVRQQVAEQQQAAQQADVAEKAAKSASMLGKRIEPGSPLEQLAASGVPGIGG